MDEAAGFHRERVPGGSGQPPSLGLVKSHLPRLQDGPPRPRLLASLLTIC
jgi:hypothetical protein